MAIFGINFNGFGSRTLRFDSQNSNVNFSGKNEDTVKVQGLKYAIPITPSKQEPKNNKTNTDDVPTLKYAIPSKNFKPYVYINPSKPKAPQNEKPDNSPGCLKYAIPKNS